MRWLKRLRFFLPSIIAVAILIPATYAVGNYYAHKDDVVGTTQATQPVPAKAPEEQLAPVDRAKVVQLHNDYRATKGLPPLVGNALLDQSAQMKADDMVAKNYWGHIAPDGTQPWYFFKSVGYNYVRAGENLAFGFRDDAALVKGWITSPEHEVNMVGNYQEIGIGIAISSNFTQTGHRQVVVIHFGTR
jgi:uncharacterized protein YkwD